MNESTTELYKELMDKPRLLMVAELKPIPTDRFQPTGFSDLGAAEYTAPDGTQMLLVESAQSMANRMEDVCWDGAKEELIEPLKGLPYIHVELDKKGAFTNSILEAHRINSEYITGTTDKKKTKSKSVVEGTDEGFHHKLKEEIGFDEKKPVSFRNFYKALLKYDPNSLVHGVFLEEIGGRLRVPRMLSAFIEASDVMQAQSGGVKFSRVEPGLKEGEGNVPYARIEYTAKEIKAYFNLDLAGLRGMGLPAPATDLLLSLSLYKVKRFLRDKLKLRTACDFEVVGGLKVIRPKGFEIPNIDTLEDHLPKPIQACKENNFFAEPPITRLEYKG